MPVEISPIDPFRRLPDVVEVYREALGIAPADERALRFADGTFERHAGHADFDFLGALDGGRLVGIVYGYTGASGQWWTDWVARAMDEETRRRWLDPPHFEVTELHVRPERQRQGLGTRLLDALLARQPHDRALLTADRTSATALPFYRKHGWTPLAETGFGAPDPRYVVLGKEGLGPGR